MKKIQKLLLAALALIMPELSASNSIKHTMLMPRPIIDNIALERAGHHEIKKTKGKFNHNFHFQTSIYTKQSVNGGDLGKYFGVNNTNQINIHGAANSAAIIANNAIDIWDQFLIHSSGAVNRTTDAEFTLNPKQEVYSFRFDLFGLTTNPFPKTFFKISAPLTYIKNDLHTQYNKNLADNDGDYISNFFKGLNINSNVIADLQDQLTAGKIDNVRKTVFGIADIDTHFGYRLVDKKTKRIYLSGLITIPTGNRPKGEFLFEPIYGNGNHFALGWELDGYMRLWKRKSHTGSLEFALKHKYTLEGREKRIIPLNLPSYPWAHYYLAQKIGTPIHPAGTALFPAANILNQDVSVRPGNSVEGIINFKFKTKRFLLDTGYNVYYKEKENMHLKTPWQDNVYAIANANYNTTAEFNANAELVRLNNDILDFDGALTPNQLSHKIFGGIGYNLNISKHPTYIGIGGSYEFANNNYELEGYEFWLKTNCAF